MKTTFTRQFAVLVGCLAVGAIAQATFDPKNPNAYEFPEGLSFKEIDVKHFDLTDKKVKKEFGASNPIGIVEFNGETFFVKSHEPGSEHTTRADYISRGMFKALGLPVIPTMLVATDDEEKRGYLVMPDLRDLLQKGELQKGFKFPEHIIQQFHLMNDLAATFIFAVWSVSYDNSPKNFFWGPKDDGSPAFLYVDFGASWFSKAKGGTSFFLPIVDSNEIRVEMTDHFSQEAINPAYARFFEFDTLSRGKAFLKRRHRKALADQMENFLSFDKQVVYDLIDTAFRVVPETMPWVDRIEFLKKAVDKSVAKDQESEARFAALEKRKTAGESLTPEEEEEWNDAERKRMQFAVNKIKNKKANDTIELMKTFRSEQEFMKEIAELRVSAVCDYFTYLLEKPLSPQKNWVPNVDQSQALAGAPVLNLFEEDNDSSVAGNRENKFRIIDSIREYVKYPKIRKGAIIGGLSTVGAGIVAAALSRYTSSSSSRDAD